MKLIFELIDKINFEFEYNKNLNFYDNIEYMINNNKKLYNKIDLSNYIEICNYDDIEYNYLIEKRSKGCKIYKADDMIYNNRTHKNELIKFNKNKYQKILIKDEDLISNIKIIQKYLQNYIIGKTIKTYYLSHKDIYDVIFYYYVCDYFKNN